MALLLVCLTLSFCSFLGEHNLDAGTELFNELLVVSGLNIRTHDVEAWIFFKLSFCSCWSWNKSRCECLGFEHITSLIPVKCICIEISAPWKMKGVSFIMCMLQNFELTFHQRQLQLLYSFCSDQCKHRYHEQEIPEVIAIEVIPF